MKAKKITILMYFILLLNGILITLRYQSNLSYQTIILLSLFFFPLKILHFLPFQSHQFLLPIYILIFQLNTIDSSDAYQNTLSICHHHYQNSLQQSTLLPTEINESRVLEGRLVVNEDRVSGYVEVKSEELRNLISKYYTSTIISHISKNNEFVNMNDLFQFDKNPKYFVQVYSFIYFLLVLVIRYSIDSTWYSW